ncbi:pinin/SDK/memA/ domain-containing protein, putative [Eimeria necatrix]|uniref:Pinin/SDK/memA/ domain-containing protein, putative n=1 Tax=Eimeria necatrix TaxID=51315 RepID=U6MF54_9EIME|nr:pinin/SDK/memA/ domain-containing protein, putative [Eimeria necatrix]CDJ62882.1 pinin/SDK/memA/ domain-containing protein, putative [Eimeria necatrix]
MADAVLRREIKRLVEEQKLLNQRLQRKPPGGPGALAPRPVPGTAAKENSQSTASGDPTGAASQKRPQAGGAPNYDFAGPEFQIAKRPKVELDPSSEKRNKRIFGFLSSHLNKAKQQLAKERDTDFAQRHKLQEERVNSKLELARKHIAEIARIQWQEQRKEDESQLAKVSSELIQKENDLMRLHLVQHYSNMEHFVGTEAQPTLFWRPAEWDSHTRRLQQQTKVWIETKIKHIQEADYTFSSVGDPESHTDANHGSGEAPASPEDRGASEVASNKEEDSQD